MSEFTPTTEQVRHGYASDPEAEYRDPVNYPAEERSYRRAFDRWLAAHDAEVRTSVVAEEPEWEDGIEYGYVDFEHGIIPLMTGYEGITHERPVRYGPWVPVEQGEGS